MKKKRIAGLFLLAPLALLTACGGGNNGLALTANWHKNTGTRDNITGTEETLEYSVAFVKSTDTGAFTLDYENGTYTTRLSAVIDSELSSTQIYRYETELKISVKFSLNGVESETYEDSVKTDAYFMTVADSLRPVRCVKEVVSTTPLTTSSSPRAKLEDNFTTFRYKTETTYNEELSSATVVTTSYTTEETENGDGTVTETEKESVSEKKVKLSGKYTYFDNDQILFALRGLDMTAASTFQTIDPQTRQEVKAGMSSAPSAISYSAAFTMGGTAVEETIDAYQVSIGYNTSNPGQGQTLVYAKKSEDANNNVYRNVLLRMEAP
ncbi:MAG: hypothetical protein ACI4ST_03125, partial [Candidatus Gallimonas sp.]